MDAFDPGLYNYWLAIVLMMTGLYVVLARPNLVKKIMGITIFQAAVIIFYVSMGKVEGGTAPIVVTGEGAAEVVYSNPVPHVLMLTAIVVGIATTALALALAVRVYETFGTLEDDEIRAAEETAS